MWNHIILADIIFILLIIANHLKINLGQPRSGSQKGLGLKSFNSAMSRDSISLDFDKPLPSFNLKAKSLFVECKIFQIAYNFLSNGNRLRLARWVWCRKSSESRKKVLLALHDRQYWNNDKL